MRVIKWYVILFDSLFKLGLLLSLFHFSALAKPTDCEQLIETLAKSISPGEGPHFPRLDQIEQQSSWGSLIEIQKEASDQLIEAHNSETQKALHEAPEALNQSLKNGVSREQANAIVAGIINHPTHGLEREKTFDPQGCYGFCFGRATLIHHQALLRQIAPAAIRKIWAVGSIEHNKWQFHVSTLIKASNQDTWWACDPIFYQANEVRKWIKFMEELSDDRRMMFFVTKANRFSVYSPVPYSKIDLFGNGTTDFYNGYFRTYFLPE